MNSLSKVKWNFSKLEYKWRLARFSELRTFKHGKNEYILSDVLGAIQIFQRSPIVVYKPILGINK